jgi:hypothetical protein
MAVPHWGEVPYFIRDRQVARFIDRNLQTSFDFPPEIVPAPTVDAVKFPRYHNVLLMQQPRKFPIGCLRMEQRDPNWRATYASNWIAKRKAAGLPHIIHDDIWRRKPPVSVRMSAERQQTA